MRCIKKYFLTALLLTPLLQFAQYTDEINTNRPGESMGAFAVGETVFQFESGVYGIMEKHDVLGYEANGFGLDLQLRYGAFLEELEFIVDLQYQFDQYSDALDTYNRNDFRQLTIGAKYLVYDPDKYYNPKPDIYSWKKNHQFKWRKLIPALAVFAGTNLPGKDNPYTFKEDKTSLKAMAITQNHFGKWVWVNNIIFDKITTEYPSMGLISTVTRGFNENWSGFVEYQGYKSDYYADAVVRLGAARLLGPNMQVDASVSTNFKDTPSILYGGVGFSWRFDANYNEIYLPHEGDREEEFEKMKNAEKDKKKKLKAERRERIKKRKAGEEAPADAPQTE